MKFLTRTIIVLVAFNMTAGNIAFTQDQPEKKTLTISGSIGLTGVEMTGLPGNPFTDQRGYYSAAVPGGFTGKVVPRKEGYNFTPEFRAYTDVTSDVTNENYAPKIIQLLIRGNAGAVGVEMRGLPGNPTTSKDGYYQATVDYGWRGNVTPLKEGFTFEPAELTYTRITSDQINQDYLPKALTYIISGNTGIGGTRMQGLPGNVFTDKGGFYHAAVPYGWSGTVTPTKEGYTFEPASKSYSRVMADQISSSYTAKPQQPDVLDPYGMGTSRSRGGRRVFAQGVDSTMGSGGSRAGGRSAGYGPTTINSAGRKALVIPAGEIKAEGLAETVEDMHVMAHILDDRFKETRRIQGLFTDFGAFFGRDNRSTEAIYMQGYGVLFLMEVNFAFSPPSKPEAKEAEKSTEAVDSTWEKARQEVFSPGASAGTSQDDSADDYNEQMVEELKKELVESLRHASNIRNVDTNEWVILTVIGGQRQFGMSFGGGGRMSGFGGSLPRTGGSSGRGMGGGMGAYGGGFVGGGYGGTGGMMGAGGGMYGGMYGDIDTYGGTAFSSSTVLTIRAKKSNVDDFAKGQSDLEQFQKFVQIFTY